MGNSGNEALPGRVQLGAIVRRRGQGAEPRRTRVVVRFNSSEYDAVVEAAGKAQLAVAAYIAISALSSGQRVPLQGIDDPHVELLMVLMDMQRQLRGACSNLNQAVTRMHTFHVWPTELESVAKHVREIATKTDFMIADLAATRRRSRRQAR